MTGITLESLRAQGMRILFGAAALMAAAVVVVDLMRDRTDYPFIGSVLAIGLLVYPLLLVRSGRIDGEARISMSMVVCAMPIMMIFAARGHPYQVDLHMVFFAGLAMTAILCDWRAILLSTAVVAVHHLGLGLLLPDWVFYGGGSFGRILLHAVILLAEAAVLVWICQQIIALLAAVGQEQAERRQLEAAAEAERAARLAELQKAMEILSASLADLRDGRLTGELPPTLPAGFHQIRSDYNGALASLRTLVSGVSDSAVQIRESAFAMADASEDLSIRSQASAASLEETTAAVGAIDARLKATAEAAATTKLEADGAMQRVAEGQRKAGEAVQAITTVSESAKAINAVMEGLDSIAFQTQVLAMNIAIEANRAGEAGAGFAVVAELVGQLAKRSEEESRSARTYIMTTQDGIATAATAVRGLEASFAHVAQAVATVNGLVESMAADNRAQSSALSEVAAAILQMDRAVQQNAAMVEENSATCRTLSEEADLLADRSRAFDVGTGGAGGTGARGRLALVA
jgi:methyl-accepting chemotaxis protein